MTHMQYSTYSDNLAHQQTIKGQTAGFAMLALILLIQGIVALALSSLALSVYSGTKHQSARQRFIQQRAEALLELRNNIVERTEGSVSGLELPLEMPNWRMFSGTSASQYGNLCANMLTTCRNCSQTPFPRLDWSALAKIANEMECPRARNHVPLRLPFNLGSQICIDIVPTISQPLIVKGSLAQNVPLTIESATSAIILAASQDIALQHSLVISEQSSHSIALISGGNLFINEIINKAPVPVTLLLQSISGTVELNMSDEYTLCDSSTSATPNPTQLRIEAAQGIALNGQSESNQVIGCTLDRGEPLWPEYRLIASFPVRLCD